MRYLLFLLCLLLVACGDEAPATVTPLPTSAPATQTPVVIVVVVTATLEPTKAARPALAATSAPTQPPATASATATRTVPSSIPTRRPTRTVTPAVTHGATRTPSATAIPCGSAEGRAWVSKVEDVLTEFRSRWQSIRAAAVGPSNAATLWLAAVDKGRALAAPAGYEYVQDDWHAMLDLFAQIPDAPDVQARDALWKQGLAMHESGIVRDYAIERNLECGTSTP